MRVRHFHNALLVSAGALTLAACGGGGGTTTAFIPPPEVTPTPTLAAVQIFPNATTTTDFAAIGVQATRTASPTVANASVSVRYDALTGLYVMAFPDAPAAPFYQFTNVTPSATVWSGETVQPNGNAPATVTVLKPTNPERQFSFTTLASYDTGGMGGGSFGWMAFGMPTAAGAVPTMGSATYAALVRGSSSNEALSIRGSATLSFDFAAGTLGGHFDPVNYDLLAFGDAGQSLGRYDFLNTVYNSGSTVFSGELSKSGITQNGSFAGQFTGPSGQELMATWRVPFGQSTELFGAWVGSK